MRIEMPFGGGGSLLLWSSSAVSVRRTGVCLEHFRYGSNGKFDVHMHTEVVASICMLPKK